MAVSISDGYGLLADDIDRMAGLNTTGIDAYAASAAPVVDESSVAFASYNKAIEDAMAAIRAESQGGGYWAATFINAIARKCSPHRYVASLPVKPRTHEAPDPYRPVCKHCGLADIAGDWSKYPCNDEWRKDIATNY